MAQIVQSEGDLKYPLVMSVIIYDVAHAKTAQKYGFARTSDSLTVIGVCFDKKYIFRALMHRSQTNVPIGMPYIFTFGVPTRI